MSTGQVILTIGAFVLLSTILVSFYGLVVDSTKAFESTQADITEIALAVSYQEIIQGMAFDQVTYGGYLNASQVNSLSTTLGPDGPDETTMETFNDIDDFNGYQDPQVNPGGVLGTFLTQFKVFYADPNNPNQNASGKTFVKRVDMKVWRASPPAQDTLRTSFVVGYFHFN
jgi:hypothetical protein